MQAVCSLFTAYFFIVQHLQGTSRITRFENPKKRYHGVTQTCFEILDRNVLLKDYDMTTPFPVQKIKRTVVVSCLCSPFKPQYQHKNSPHRSLHISLKNQLREFVLRSKHFHLSDFTNSYNLVSWSCIGVVRRRLMLVIIGFHLKGLKQCLFGGNVRTIWNYWQWQIFFLGVRESLFRIKSLLSRYLIDSFLQFFDSSLLFLTLVSEFRELLWG